MARILPALGLDQAGGLRQILDKSTVALDETRGGVRIAQGLACAAQMAVRLGEGLPLLAGPCRVLGDILGDVQGLLGRADDVLVAGQKALDVLEYLVNLSEVLKTMAADVQDRVATRMQELCSLLVDFREVIKSYGEPGFLKRLWEMRKRIKTLAKVTRDIQRLFENLKDMYQLAKDRQMVHLLESANYKLEAEVERRVQQRCQEHAGESEEQAALALQSDPAVVQVRAAAEGRGAGWCPGW